MGPTKQNTKLEYKHSVKGKKFKSQLAIAKRWELKRQVEASIVNRPTSNTSLDDANLNTIPGPSASDSYRPNEHSNMPNSNDDLYSNIRKKETLLVVKSR